MSAIQLVFLALLILIVGISAQYDSSYYPYYYGNQQSAYNNYYQAQAPSPQQQSAEPVTLPSTIFSFGSPAYAKTSDLFVLPKFF